MVHTNRHYVQDYVWHNYSYFTLYVSALNNLIGGSTRTNESFSGCLTGATMKQGTFGLISWKDFKPDKSLEDGLAVNLHSIAYKIRVPRLINMSTSAPWLVLQKESTFANLTWSKQKETVLWQLIV